MKIDEVKVTNFRCIEDTGWVEIQPRITTLLGKNEVGKTAFLKAIDKNINFEEVTTRDVNKNVNIAGEDAVEIASIKYDIADVTSGEIAKLDWDEVITSLYYSPKLELTTKRVRPGGSGSRVFNDVNLDIILTNLVSYIEEVEESYGQSEQETLKRIYERSKTVGYVSNGNDMERLSLVLRKLSDFADEDEVFACHHDLIEEDFFYLDDDVDAYEVPSAFDIFSELPECVYYQQSDRIDDQVSIDRIGSDEHRTFSNLLDLFDVDVNEMDQKGIPELIRETDRVSENITVEMNEYWGQKSVDVRLRFFNDMFAILLKDTELADGDLVDRQLLPPSQRSRGFQWFLSFYINASRNATKVDDDSILLFDDPAAFLHPEGKQNWLEAVESLGEDNQVIYTSHSPYLIRKEAPERIRIVEDLKGEGTRVTSNFIESSGSSLQPLYEALGIGWGDTPFVAKRKLLVEGPSDYYIISGLAHYFKEYQNEDILEWDDLSLMVTNGGDQMIHAAKWVASENFAYALLLDNDDKGQDVENRIRKHHHEISDDKVFLLEKEDGPDHPIEIEDMFDPSFYVDCVNEAYPEVLDDFDPIEISISEEGWDIEGVEYEGRKIISKINKVFDDRDDGDLKKIVVAKEIMRRLKGGDVSESDVEAFKPILGKLNAAT